MKRTSSKKGLKSFRSVTEGLPNPAVRGRDLLQSFSFIAAASLAVFGLLQAFEGGDAITRGWVEIVGASVILCNALVARYHKHADLALNVLMFAVYIILVFLFITGGIARTGIYWFFMFPIAAFFLTGLRKGIEWSLSLALISMTVLLLGQASMMRLPYSPIEYRQMTAVVTVIALLAFLYERRRTQDESLIVQKSEELASVLEHLPVGVVIGKADGKLVMMNRAGIEIFGRDIDPDLSAEDQRRAFRLIKEDGTPYPVEELPAIAAARSGRITTKSDIFYRKNGRMIALRAVGAPVKDPDGGKLLSVVGIFDDISREHAIDRLKSEFISVASHQLRTPLTGIKWYVEMLERSPDDMLGAEQRGYINEIAENNRRMLALVEDLLNVSRIETGRKFSIEKAPCDLAAIINAAIEEQRPLAGERKIGLRADPSMRKEIPLEADEDKIRHVFQNLISNGIKYSKEGGEVSVSCKVSARPGAVTCSVKDAGIGIPEHQQSRIFEKFFRAENALKSETDGTGLGLYIAKAIVEGHGGKIWFVSKANKGTTFFFSLPLGKPKREREAGANTAA